MKRLPVLASLLMFSAIPHPVLADTEFVDDVPLEVVQQFIGNPFRASKLYSDILDAFPPFALPANFRVMASADLGFLQRVLLSSTLEDEEASAAIVAAFADEGWVELAIYGMTAQQNGFISAEPPVRPRQLCHDDYGNLSITVGGDTGTRYININRNVGVPGMAPGGPSCARMIEQTTQNSPNFGFRPGNMLNSYVPRLIMPESNALPTQPMSSFMQGGGGGSSNDWETRGILTIDWNLDEIYAHFARQIAEQGWTSDSAATGTMMANGSWTKTSTTWIWLATCPFSSWPTTHGICVSVWLARVEPGVERRSMA
jgi:hypothetical protein